MDSFFFFFCSYLIRHYLYFRVFPVGSMKVYRQDKMLLIWTVTFLFETCMLYLCLFSLQFSASSYKQKPYRNYFTLNKKWWHFDMEENIFFFFFCSGCFLEDYQSMLCVPCFLSISSWSKLYCPSQYSIKHD